jgi:hypothetical protein
LIPSDSYQKIDTKNDTRLLVSFLPSGVMLSVVVVKVAAASMNIFKAVTTLFRQHKAQKHFLLNVFEF